MPLTALLPQLRRFLLRRASDPTGVSGAGVIALGVQFPNGVCVLQWAPPAMSVVIHASAAEIESIHGHGGQTPREWIDEAPDLQRALHQGATALAFLAWVQMQHPDLWARWQAGPGPEETAGE
jgi:hypothetical protein